MDRKPSTAFPAVLDTTAATSAMPPLPKRRRHANHNTKNKTQNRNTNTEKNSYLHQDDENSQSWDEYESKRRKRSIVGVGRTGRQHQVPHHELLGELGDGGGPRGIAGGMGVRTPPYDTYTRRRVAERGAETRSAGSEARYGDGRRGRGETSKARHLPPIGSFKPPPRPTRSPLAQIRNQNNHNHNHTKNKNENANFTKTRTKNAEARTPVEQREKIRVTYIENHKGEIEIVKYKNTKRGSIVALSNLTLDSLNQQYQTHQRLLQEANPAEQSDQETDENEYHELKRVDKPSKREYRKELYQLFKRDLRDWEEQQYLLKITNLPRENIHIDPRFLTMENHIQVWFDGEPPRATSHPETPSQQQVQQPRANEPQSGERRESVALGDLVMRGEQGGLLSRSHYSLDAGNGPDNNNMGGNNGYTAFGEAPMGFVNRHVPGDTPAPRGVIYGRADGGAAEEREYGDGNMNNDASAGLRTPVNQVPVWEILLEQAKQMSGFPPPNQHGVKNFVELAAEGHKMQEEAQVQSQQNQVLSEQMNRLDGVPMMGAMGPPAYYMQNLQPSMPFGHYDIASIGQHNSDFGQNAQANPGHFLQQQMTGFSQQTSDFGQNAQAGPGQLLQRQAHIYGTGLGARSASPALFMQPVPRTTSPFPRWDSGDEALALSPPRMGAFAPDEDLELSQNAFATQDGDVDMPDFSPHRGPVDFDGVSMYPLMFKAQLPEHTFRAQQAFAQNSQQSGVGDDSGLLYAPGHGFVNVGEVIPNAQVFQLEPNTAGFLSTYHTLPQVRERFDQLMLAQYPPHPVSLQMLPPPMPIGVGLPMQVPPLPVYPPLKMGLQQQQMYNGPRHPMLSNNQNSQLTNVNYHGLVNEGTRSPHPYQSPYPSQIVNNYGLLLQESEMPKPIEPSKLSQQSAAFSPSRSAMGHDNVEEPTTPQYTRQGMIISHVSPDIFRMAHRRRRNSFEQLLYSEHLAKEALKLNNKNGHMAVEVTPKSVAESYPDPPHSGRVRSSNAKTMRGGERYDPAPTSTIEKATRRQRKSILRTPTLAFREKTAAGEFNGFNERAKYTGVGEKTIASAHFLSLADRSRRHESALAVEEEDVDTDIEDLDDPPSSYNRETGTISLSDVELSKKESTKAIAMTKRAVTRTGGGGVKGLAHRPALPPTLEQKVLAWQFASTKKHSTGLEEMYGVEKAAVENADREAMGLPPPANNDVPAPAPKKQSHKKKVAGAHAAPVAAPLPARVIVIPRQDQMWNEARLHFAAKEQEEECSLVGNEESEEARRDLADDGDYCEAIVAFNAEDYRFQSQQAFVEDEEDSELGRLEP